jgi:hypothetical protein
MFLYVSSWLTLKTKKMQMVCAQQIIFFKIYLGAYSKIWKTKESNTTLQEQAIIEHTVLFILVSYATFSFTELWTWHVMLNTYLHGCPFFTLYNLLIFLVQISRDDTWHVMLNTYIWRVVKFFRILRLENGYLTMMVYGTIFLYIFRTDTIMGTF